MSIKRCKHKGQPALRWNNGTPFTYNPDSKQSETHARKKAIAEGVSSGEYFKEAIEKIWKFRNKRP